MCHTIAIDLILKSYRYCKLHLRLNWFIQTIYKRMLLTDGLFVYEGVTGCQKTTRSEPSKVSHRDNFPFSLSMTSLRWRHNGHDGVSNHQPHHCLLNRLFGCTSKKTSKLRVTGLCAGNSPGTGEFPSQMASNAENVSIWWRHHV